MGSTAAAARSHYRLKHGTRHGSRPTLDKLGQDVCGALGYFAICTGQHEPKRRRREVFAERMRRMVGLRRELSEEEMDGVEILLRKHLPGSEKYIPA